MRPALGDRMGTALVVLALVTLIAGNLWRYTIGWVGFGVLAAGLAACAIAVLVLRRRDWSIGLLPTPLVVFLALATLSLAWSYYPGATAIGLAATWLTSIVAIAIAITTDWPTIVRCLGIALRIVLGLSLAFELFVAAVLRRPLLPLVPQPGVDYDHLPDPIPKMLYWSRNELFQVLDDGKIQGVVGNSALLGFAALLGLVVFGVQLADRRISRAAGILWVTVAAFTLFATRSATVTVALVAVIVVALAALALRRARTARTKMITSIALLGAGGLALVLAIVLRGQVLQLLGKSEDLTGRLGIWEAVIGFAQQRPAFGWGWVSYWLPWFAPFDDPAFFRNGVQQTHAHNAWLDIWLQLGVVGLVVVAALVLGALIRLWLRAVDARQVAPGQPLPYRALDLLPLLLLIALIAQSVAESRLLVEFGWAMLVILAVQAKRPVLEPAPRGSSSSLGA